MSYCVPQYYLTFQGNEGNKQTTYEGMYSISVPHFDFSPTLTFHNRPKINGCSAPLDIIRLTSYKSPTREFEFVEINHQYYLQN